MIAEELFFDLDAPVARVGSLNVPVPFSPKLEDYMLPNATDIINTVKKIVLNPGAFELV
jgi:pyruvate dehydrogenase E1 component beta subunit